MKLQWHYPEHCINYKEKEPKIKILKYKEKDQLVQHHRFS